MKNKYNANLFTYFESRVLFLGGGMSLMYLYSGKDTYISAILGILLGIIFIYLFNKIKINKENILFKIIYFIYILFLIFIILIIISTFIYSYFLVYTPAFLSCLPLLILAILYNSKKNTLIYYVSFILFFLSISIIILKSFLLIREFDISNILPLLSVDNKNIFYSSFLYAILSVSPYLLNKNEDTNFKDSLKYYLIASISNILIILTTTFILGDNVSLYSYPEYVILRKIKLFDSIENIENFLSIPWFFDVFIALCMCGLKLKETLKKDKPIIPFIISIIILFIVNIFIANNFYISIVIYKIFPFILLIFMFLLLVLSIL